MTTSAQVQHQTLGLLSPTDCLSEQCHEKYVTPAICLTLRPVGIVPGFSTNNVVQDGGPGK
jgi:hypothetical protein